MIAFDVYQPRCVLVLGGQVGAQRLTREAFERDWCVGRKQALKARRKGLLRSVHSISFDRFERRWRAERDAIGRDVLVIGPRVALLHCARDESDRWMQDQLVDLFGDRGWLAREAAEAAGALSARLGHELESAAI